MDLTFSEEQALLRTVALDFLKSEMPKERVLDVDSSPDGFSPELWGKMVQLGWAGMSIPEEYGGGGSGLVDTGIFAEALGEYACPSPLLTVTLGAQLLLEAGSGVQKRTLLRAIAERGQVVTFACTEPEYGWGPEHISLQARRSGDGWVLDGTKLFVPDAHIASQLIVAARTANEASPERGVSLFLVDPGTKGVSIRKLRAWASENMCEVTFANAAVPAANVMGEPGAAWGAIERARDRATAVVCAYMAGGTRHATEMAIEYSKTRIVFGVAIGTFQRIQDHIVIGLNDADAAKWSAYEALWKLENGRPDATLATSTAKAIASVAFFRACEESHQVHAGVGTDMTLGLASYTRRARTLQHYLGDAIYHRRRMARLLQLDTPSEDVRAEGMFAT